MENKPIGFTEEQIRAEQASFITKVFTWMTLALAITGFVALAASLNLSLMKSIFENRFMFFGLIILEFVMVGALVGWVRKMSATVATMIFIGYSLLNGLTLSVIFLLYTPESIAVTFFVTAGTFAAMAFLGYTTKKDLTSFGNLMIMGLFGIIIASLVNFFLESEGLYWIITYVGVAVFIGLVAYDTQKIKRMNIIGNEGTEEDKKESIMGALTLYLDFINLFLMLLRIFGGRKD